MCNKAHATHTGNPQDKPECLEGICKSEMWYPQQLKPSSSSIVLDLLRLQSSVGSGDYCSQTTQKIQLVLALPNVRLNGPQACSATAGPQRGVVFGGAATFVGQSEKTRAAPTLLCFAPPSLWLHAVSKEIA